MINFVAIDFETATSSADSACAVGIVIVEEGRIVEEFHQLIQPPDNAYNYHNIRVHGIQPQDTLMAPDFHDIYPEIKKRVQGQIMVAHNASFDRRVLMKSMEYYRLDFAELGLAERWECTLKIYRRKGYKPANLAACCARHNIALVHHEALSDARGCAKLYLIDKAPLCVSF